MKAATKVKENLPVGINQEQIQSFLQKHPDYVFHNTLDYPCQSGAGMRSKIILRHKDSLVKTFIHPTIEAKIEIIGFSENEILQEYEEWCESI